MLLYYECMEATELMQVNVNSACLRKNRPLCRSSSSALKENLDQTNDGCRIKP
jgi:hypothetical protein